MASRSTELEFTASCKSSLHRDNKEDAAVMPEDLNSVFVFIRSLFAKRHSLVLIDRFLQAFKDPSSQVVIRLEHVLTSFLETVAVSKTWGVPSITRRADMISTEPGRSHLFASIL